MKTSTLVRSFRIAAVLLTFAGSFSLVRAEEQGDFDSITQWCNDSIIILDRAEEQAKMVYSMGRATDAKAILLRGLQRASSSAPTFGHHGPITMRAIQRVTQIATIVNRSISGDPLGDRTSVVFMFRGYEFIRDVARNLDVPYYIPYYHGRRGTHFDVNQFEYAFVQVAADQLDMVVDSLVVSGGQGGTAPLGTPRAILKAIEVAAAASAADLRDSLWSVSFACEIEQLSDLSAKLRSFNAGDRTLYRNEPEAFYATTAEAKYLVSMINGGIGCGGYVPY